jgi:hypothetical protein
MNDEIEPESRGESLGDFGYTAFEKWPYKRIIYIGEEKSWVDLGTSFYWASHHLIKNVVDGSLREDIEGIAAVHLFRHYLELALKQIIFRGRYLKSEDVLANTSEIKKVANIHDLNTLWGWVLKDAKPKMASWDGFDIDFVEQCIVEFDSVDKKGFAFRYEGQGGERCYFSFQVMLISMEHLWQVLEGIVSYLVETYHQNLEYLDHLRSEAGW